MILLQQFYADDGATCDNDPARVQSLLADAFKDRVERVVLEMNDIRTKAMIVEGAKPPKMQSKAAFDDRLHKQEGTKTHRERTLEKVQYQLCGFMLQRQGLKQHQSRKICERGRETWATSQENPVSQQRQETHGEQRRRSNYRRNTASSPLTSHARLNARYRIAQGRYSEGRTHNETTLP
jgi:hypothetical protein